MTDGKPFQSFAAIFVLIVLTASFHSASAGTTGKLAGIVTDADGDPLAGVAVTVSGTRLGAMTDAEGRYVILLVPPGEHELAAQLLGYERTTIRGIVVNTDLTTEIDFALREEAIDVGTVVIIADRPPVDADVTSSQIIVSEEQVSEAPVPAVLDFMAYEPGVSIRNESQLEIRGGGAEEIRFQVDDLDRTDALTNKGLTHLNMSLVSEVTVLTGGFNAEYGNMRSGVVNAIYKDGTERGWGLPWVAGAFSYSPAQRKHFGPGAYDRDQYTYQLLGDPAITGASWDNLDKVYWPQMYEATRQDTALMARLDDPVSASLYSVWNGWSSRKSQVSLRGAYGVKREWTAERLREAWMWEANMDEQVWQYANEPDWNLDLSIGQALPSRLGGIVLGYSRAKEMTPLPAVRPYFSDETWDLKVTLTPTDWLRVRLSGMVGQNLSTGAGNRNMAAPAEELAQAGGGSISGNDPIGLRSASQLFDNFTGGAEFGEANKLNLSWNARLQGDYRQAGASVTLTFGPMTFAELGYSRLETDWLQPRNPPRADPDDFGGGYGPTNGFAMGGEKGFLHLIDGREVYNWVSLPLLDATGAQVLDGTENPIMVDYPSHPSQVVGENVYPRSAFEHPYMYPVDDLPTMLDEARELFTTRDFIFVNDDATEDTVTIVSPQGFYEKAGSDLSGLFNTGSHRAVVFDHSSASDVFRGSLTRAWGNHTTKLGAEVVSSHVDFSQIDTYPISQIISNERFYVADPVVAGLYIQDKYETRGMIVNYGVRADRFYAGSPVYTPDNIFDATYWQKNIPGALLDSLNSLYPSRAWPDPVTWATIPENPLDENDILALYPQRDPNVWWKFSPRVGISHAISVGTKFFFNYGHFYSMPQGKFLHGVGVSGILGDPVSHINAVFYPNLRPPKTAMYELGVENAFDRLGLLLTVRGYAKYNTDQIASVRVLPRPGQQYGTYRNSNWETIKGVEIKLARTSGRYFYGWATYEYVSTASGQIGYHDLQNEPTQAVTTWPAVPVTSDSPDNFQALIGARTPREWGPFAGGWGLSIVQTWREGSEVVYNPEQTERYLLPSEYFMKWVDTWNTDLKLSKSFNLSAGRSISVYMDVSNLWNTKRLNSSVVTAEYTEYVIERRTRGGEEGLRYGSEPTWAVFTEPFQDTQGNWCAPLRPDLEFAQFMNPRAFRFGIRVNL